MLTSFSATLVGQLFDGLGDVVYCVKNRKGEYLAVNQAFAERANVSDRSSMIGRTSRDFFPASMAEVYEEQDELVFREERALVDQLERITNRDGSVGWYLASKYPVVNEDGRVDCLVGVSQDLHTPTSSDPELADLQKLVDSIRQNLDQPLKLEQLAEEIGLSQMQLDRRMKRVYRLSTKKFIMKCRLEEAMRQLVQTSIPLSEIALACGFSDQSALTRQFRAAVSMTPAAYRKSHTDNK